MPSIRQCRISGEPAVNSVREFSPSGVDSDPVQFRIDFIGTGRLILLHFIQSPPSVLKRVETFPPALGIWPVPSGTYFVALRQWHESLSVSRRDGKRE